MTFPPDLVELEDWHASYGGNGVVSHVVFPNGSVATISQAVPELIVAVMLARLEMEAA